MSGNRSLPLWLQAAWFGVVILINPVSALSQSECRSNTKEWDQMEQREITLIDSSNRPIMLTARFADTPRKRAAGYQFLCPDDVTGTTILFAFEGDTRTLFHMRNVKLSLDILFFQEDGRLLSATTMDPVEDRLYGPGGKFRYALEAPSGFLASLGLDRSAKKQDWRLVISDQDLRQ